jgi:hypothetical protein
VNLEEGQLSTDDAQRLCVELARLVTEGSFQARESSRFEGGNPGGGVHLSRFEGGNPGGGVQFECIRWRQLRWARFLCGCFGGNSEAEAREASSTRRNLQSVLTEWGHRSLLRRRRSFSLAIKRVQPMLIAAGVVVSTNKSERVTPTTRSMVNGLASACPATALLALVENVVLPDDFGLRVLRDERDCLAYKSTQLCWEATVDKCSPQKRVTCSRLT